MARRFYVRTRTGFFDVASHQLAHDATRQGRVEAVVFGRAPEHVVERSRPVAAFQTYQQGTQKRRERGVRKILAIGRAADERTGHTARGQSIGQLVHHARLADTHRTNHAHEDVRALAQWANEPTEDRQVL